MYDYVTVSPVLEEDPTCHAWIEPRYLAGMGDSTHVFRALADDFGWDHTNRQGQGEWATSPCGVAIVRLMPREHEDPWGWSIDVDDHGFDRWHGTFEHDTPEELVGALATALAHRLANPDVRPHPRAITEPLEAAGWELATVNARTVRASSPDGLLVLHHTADGFGDPAEDWTWHFSAGEERDPVWSGRMTARTPRDVVHAGLAALARPEPVLREARWLPNSSLHLIRARPSHWVPTAAMSTAAVPPRAATDPSRDQVAFPATHYTSNTPTTSITPRR